MKIKIRLKEAFMKKIISFFLFLPIVYSMLCFNSYAEGYLYQDKIKLKDGSEFQGNVESQFFNLLSDYAQIRIPKEYIDAIYLEGERRNVANVLLITGDRFSGFLVDKVFNIADEYGNNLTVRKEKISEIKFVHAKQADIKFSPDEIEMRNTDVFHARIITPEFTIETSIGNMKFPVSKIDSIEFEGEERVIGKINLKGGKGFHQGRLKNEDIIMETQFGQKISIYKDKIQKITFKTSLPNPTAGKPARVTFGDFIPSDREVKGKYILLLRKASKSGLVSLSTTVTINGQKIGEFIGDRTIPVSGYLRQGINRIEIETKPLEGLTSTNYLIMKVGSVKGKIFKPQLYFETNEGWSSNSNGWYRKVEKTKFVIPYFIYEPDTAVGVGDIVLFSTPKYSNKNVPLMSKIYIDSKLIALASGRLFGVKLEDIGKRNAHKLKIVTSSIKGIRGENWLNFDIGRIVDIRDGEFKIQSILSFSNNEGWKFESGLPRPVKSETNEVIFELPLSL